MNAGSDRQRRALLSVSDKTDLTAFAKALSGLGFEIVSTGGTAQTLRGAGIAVTDVSAITGFPEIMDGRVKTLHPGVHAGLLARSGVDESVLSEHNIGWIDLLVVNLYPFQRVVAQPGCSEEDAIENIDIGGPAMLRAAAKNHARLTVVVDKADYAAVVEAYERGEPSAALKRRLALKAFAHTATYDAAIADYLHSIAADGKYPQTLLLSGRLAAELRYGENPHQSAALYSTGTREGTVANARQLQGKPLSYNNLGDADAALQCVKSFDATACVIVKHANPCGVAVSDPLERAYLRAYEGDPTSAFGGVIACNAALDAATAKAITDRQYAEVIVAPGIAREAQSILAAKPNIRVLDCGRFVPAGAAAWDIKSIDEGLLVQQRDSGALADVELEVGTSRAPTRDELEDLEFAWRVVKYVKSNAIVYASGRRTVGIGAGQMSRVVSAKIAALKAEEEGLALEGAVMASDAFFPFRDSIDDAARHGIRAIIQPGGSVRDEEVIAAADEHGIAMVFTGMRHFRH
jgi:phosphoribosylaminoimidazolecarboxamide formyltransferase/IMP cyclohydrolase